MTIQPGDPSTSTNPGDAVLGKFKLVTIDGLVSKEGKKLNGGHGIILGGLVESNTRFPVRIYALADGKLVDKPMDKKIKVENLKSAAYGELFWDASKKFGAGSITNTGTSMYGTSMYLDELETMDLKDPLFWLEAHHVLNPGHERGGIVYAGALVSSGNTKKAVKVCSNYASSLDESDPHFYMNCCDISTIYSAAGVDLDKALELALKIPLESNINTEWDARLRNRKPMKQRVLELVANIRQKVTDMINRDARNEHPELAVTLMKATKFVFEREPDDPINQISMAVAHCLCENHLEGARMYRKAIASGRLNHARRTQAVHGAITAQLQSPGMRLENLYIVSNQPPVYYCIQPCDRHALTRIGEEIRLEPGVEVTEYHGPTDMDDPKFFSASFLEQLRLD